MDGNEPSFIQTPCTVETPVHDDESGEKDMEVYEDKEEIIGTFFQQWSKKKIRFFYQKIWQKESQEYEVN